MLAGDEAAALEAAVFASLGGGNAAPPEPRLLVEQAALAAASSPHAPQLKTLGIVCRHVRDAPTSATYRRLRLEKAAVQALWRCGPTRAVLEAVGWAEEDDGGARVLRLTGDADGALSRVAAAALEDRPAPVAPPAEAPRPRRRARDVCAECGRPVGVYSLPPGGGFFRRARAPSEGVVCTVCEDYVICGACHNAGLFSHDAAHVFAALGYGPDDDWDRRGHHPHRGARRPHPSPYSDGIHGRRGPWG